MATKRISFVIVNYNTKDLLHKCVSNLVDIWPNIEIFVVDNGSKDGSIENLEHFSAKHSFIHLIKTENKGISAAHNLALKKAMGDYICYLGTDAFPDKEAIKNMFGFMEMSKETGILTPRLVLRDGSIDKDAHRGFPTPWAAFTHFVYLDRLFPKCKIFNKYFMGWEDYYKPHPIQACISHFMFTRKEIYEKGLKWDDDYFVFGEDIDFCYRVSKLGYKIIYLGNTEVLHYKGASIGRKSTKDIKNVAIVSFEDRLAMAKASTNAMRLFYKKHYSKKYPAIITIPVMAMVSLMEEIRVLKVKIGSPFR